MLQNHVLDVEDLIDVLTLRDSADEHPTALELIKNAKVAKYFRTVFAVAELYNL